MHPILRKILHLSQKRRIRIGAAAVFVVLLIIAYSVMSGTQTEVNAWVNVQQGEFNDELIETGTVRTASSVQIKAPSSRASLQILDLVPEGTTVKEGDFLVQFDMTSLQDQLETQVEALELAEMDLRRVEEDLESQMSTLESNLTSANYTLEAAEISIELLQYESEVNQEVAKLNLEKARLSYDEAVTRIENQKIINAGNLQNAQYTVKRAQERIDDTKRQIESMTIRSPASGMVVYEELGGFGTTPHKITVGDTPRPGNVLISLPDLSHILVIIKVNELDADHIRLGQEAFVRLDAYEDRMFSGKVTTIAPLIDYKNTTVSMVARLVLSSGQEETIDEVPTYEVTIALDESDPVLKPGMTARVRIVLDSIPDTFYVPIGAVYEDDKGMPFVYTHRSWPNPVPVTLGMRNDRFIVVTDGITNKDQIALAPAVANAYPLGWYREMSRRQSAVAELGVHIEKMNELGITGEPIVTSTIDYSTLPVFLQGYARMFDEEGCPLSAEQLAQLTNLQPGPAMSEALTAVLNGQQQKVLEQFSQSGGEQNMLFMMQDGGRQIMGPGGPGGGGGRGGR
ncbi:efflux RND transporter periplasmic adaptor subunit [Candidatus Latescibacterota bacterium]